VTSTTSLLVNNGAVLLPSPLSAADADAHASVASRIIERSGVILIGSFSAQVVKV